MKALKFAVLMLLLCGTALANDRVPSEPRSIDDQEASVEVISLPGGGGKKDDLGSEG